MAGMNIHDGLSAGGNWQKIIVGQVKRNNTAVDGPEAAPRPPVDLSHHFSVVTANRTGSLVKEFYKYFAIPGIQNLAGGLPHLSYFPLDTLEAAVAHPNRIAPDANPASAKLLIPKQSDTPDVTERIDLATALQYSGVDGYPPLLSFVRQFVREHLHPNVPYEGGPEVIMTCGATDGFSKSVEAFTNPWDASCDWIGERQAILCEEFTYMNAIQTARPRGVNIVPVAVDSEGMKANGKGGLADVLKNWDYARGRRPHLMYTVTIGQNPTGAVLGLARRREIYALCRKYDIIIIEDDPYYHLQYPSAERLEAQLRSRQHDDTASTRNYNARGKSSGFEFLDSLVPSYLSIDIDGRVVRLDTFSKSIAPGCRLGWLTAQPKVVERITRITETTTQFPSGFVQAMVAQLIMGGQEHSKGKPTTASGWGVDGWVRWLEGLRGGYERRMQSMCTILEKGKFTTEDDSRQHESSSWQIIDKRQMFDFDFPRGGMFVWIQLHLESHVLWGQIAPEELATALWKYLMRKPYLCLTAPGFMFAPTDEVKRQAWRYLRITFAPMDESEVERAAHSLVEGMSDFWQIKSLDELPDDDDDN